MDVELWVREKDAAHDGYHPGFGVCTHKKTCFAAGRRLMSTKAHVISQRYELFLRKKTGFLEVDK